MTAAIEVRGLSKTYRRRGGRSRALDGLDLVVERGGVHGFLGPNGSGKTTTIRVLLGLARADAGTARLLGHDVPARLPDVVGHVGALVEESAFLPGLSGRAQLRLLAQATGVPRTRVEAVLELVRLRDRADERVKGYSLGMRQRLGIAAALLKDPLLLVLDEPSNGLDPAGMKEMRDLVRELGTGGRTVFLSSHLLGEVQQVCDRVSIMAAGRCLVTGPVREVLAAHAHGGVVLAVDRPDAAADVLRRAGYAVADVGGGRLRVGGRGALAPGAEGAEGADGADGARPVTDPAELTRLLGAQGLWLRELVPAGSDLESAYLEITGGRGLGGAA